MARIHEVFVNGTAYVVDVEAERRLLSVLRDDLDLTGAKDACGEGQCGSCTVLVDGKVALACVTSVGAVAGKQITTVEGLAANGSLHPLQQAFLDEGAWQCGYCTPGMLMAGVALLATRSDPNDNEIRRGMQGNLCRCGTYPRIVRAIRRAATQLRPSEAVAGTHQ